MPLSKTWVASSSSAIRMDLLLQSGCISVRFLLWQSKIDDLYQDREAGLRQPRQLPEQAQVVRHGELGRAPEAAVPGVVAARELLGKAKDLARPLREKVGAVLLGYNVRAMADELIKFGADKVYMAEHKLLQHFLPVPYGRVTVEMVEKFKPNFWEWIQKPIWQS